MSSKVVLALVALAVVSSVATYHFTHRDGKGGVVPNKTNTTTNITASTTNESHHVPNIILMFKSYKANNNLKFGAAEEGKRFDIFTKNVHIIEAHNSKNSSYKLGVTPFAHLTLEEFAALKLGFNGPKANATKDVPAVLVGDSNEELDWSTKGAVTPVKNQGSCGSCWSFSATGALEGLNYVKTGKLVSLSEQELVDCSTSYGNNGCNGGLMNSAFKYVSEHGLATEADYPYTATDGSCKTKAKAFKNTGSTTVPANKNSELVKAIKTQPVAVAIEADTSAFQLYRSGVLTGSACGTQLDHGVLAVGYGSQNGVAYIKVKNSWGPSWGASGFILIGQAEGAGVCGINKMASYPTL